MKNKKQNPNMKLVTALLPEAYLNGLDDLVRANMYPNRSCAIRNAVRDMLKQELWGNKSHGKTNAGDDRIR
ncbi:MAG: ribbon-helix-helix domain-containing protein [Candidatus Bathyarchaeota archaeon]|nr:ribbon-helix-helix domain-containing protein [Candidatus Termiticorpusculum sp.]